MSKGKRGVHHKYSVAVISPEFRPYTNGGGAATFNEELAHVLSDIGLDVHVISFHPEGKVFQKKLGDNITHHLIGLKTDIKALNFIYHKCIRPFLSLTFFRLPELFFVVEWNFFCWWYFRKLHKEKHFIAIHSPSYHCPSLLIKLLYKKIYLSIHIQGPQEGLNKYIFKNLDYELKARLERLFTTRFSDVVVTCNMSIAQQLDSLPIRPKRTIYIPNFISNLPTNTIEQPNLDNLVFWGRIEYRKGVEVLINTYLQLRNRNKKLRLWLIGEVAPSLRMGSRFVSLQEYLDNLNVSEELKHGIYHVPKIDNKETLKSLIRMLNGICIFPSLHEPFGFVYIEAMSMGMITIGTSSGEGKLIIVEGKSGFVSDPTVKGLTNTLKTIFSLSNSELLSIAMAARKRVEMDYSSQAVAGKYRDIYSEVFNVEII